MGTSQAIASFLDFANTNLDEDLQYYFTANPNSDDFVIACFMGNITKSQLQQLKRLFGPLKEDTSTGTLCGKTAWNKKTVALTLYDAFRCTISDKVIGTEKRHVAAYTEVEVPIYEKNCVPVLPEK